MLVGLEVLQQAQEVILEDLAAEEMDQVQEALLAQMQQLTLAQVVVEGVRLQELETLLVVKALQVSQLFVT